MSGISIKLNDETEVRSVCVIERVFPDRSAGQYAPGWLVDLADGAPDDRFGDDEYAFVDEAGVVWTWVDRFDPAHISKPIGVAPEIKAASDKMERMLDEGMREFS